MFENLGASVVYENGMINAQGRGNNVSLHIGSTQATVNGQPAALDVAPFIIGASTYVPLRFVSQALGASVNYDGVEPHRRDQHEREHGGERRAAESDDHARAQRERRRRGDARLPTSGRATARAVSSRRPLIEATFAGGTVDPNSVESRAGRA